MESKKRKKKSYIDENGDLVKVKRQPKNQCISCYGVGPLEFKYCGVCSFQICIDCLFSFAYVHGSGENGLSDIRIKCFYCRKHIPVVKGMLKRIFKKRRFYCKKMKNDAENMEFIIYKDTDSQEIGIARTIQIEDKNEQIKTFEELSPMTRIPDEQANLIVNSLSDIFGTITRSNNEQTTSATSTTPRQLIRFPNNPSIDIFLGDDNDDDENIILSGLIDESHDLNESSDFMLRRSEEIHPPPPPPPPI